MSLIDEILGMVLAGVFLGFGVLVGMYFLIKGAIKQLRNDGVKE
jgi:uncharacterized protein YneF (UPF0154 family)